MIEFRCQACGKPLKLPHSFAGKTTTCTACGRMLAVPGLAAGGAAPQPPKPSAAAMQLCVDCGGSFPTGQMMSDAGQLVCTSCFYKRPPAVQLPARSAKTKGKRRKVLFWCAVAVAAGIALAILLKLVL